MKSVDKFERSRSPSTSRTRKTIVKFAERLKLTPEKSTLSAKNSIHLNRTRYLDTTPRKSEQENLVEKVKR